MLEEITIPNMIFFLGCSYLKHVTIHSSVVEIEDSTFSKCWPLIEIYISYSVRKIGDFTFMDYHSLKSIANPSSVNEIGNLH